MKHFSLFDGKHGRMKNLALKDRMIIIDEHIYDGSVEKAEYFLRILKKIDSLEGDNRPIRIVVKSFGGSVYDGLSLMGLIEEMKDQGYEITTEIFGYAMSMGGLISVIGSKRKMSRYATFMIHQPSSWMRGNLKDIEDETKELNRLWKLSKKIFMENSNITEKWMDDIYEYKKDMFLSAEECLELGLIDEIV